MKSESQLFDFIKTVSNPTIFKEPKSGKFILANESNAKILGLESPDQLVGLTVRDINFSQSQWGRPWAENIEKMDWLVQDRKCSVETTHPFLDKGGLLRYAAMTKSPIFGNSGKVLGIITSSQELTQHLSHNSLYYLYKKICGKKAAIKKLLHHLDVESWFCALPTERELLVLLERVAGKADKEIARTHHVSTRTTETHFVNLRAKLKGEALPSIIAYLRKQRHGIDVS